MNILVTGTAGFIGFHVANRLLHDGQEVVGIDSINDYYDTDLKYERLRHAGIDKQATVDGQHTVSNKTSSYSFYKGKLEDKNLLEKIFARHSPQVVINLAAQAGVRHSLNHPDAYISSNITGFMNLVECCRHSNVQHLVYASTSGVYGLNEVPYSTSQKTDEPISIYAVTKKTNELMAHAYGYLFKLRSTGLRFFSVYGPWGRPDMALFLFTKKILAGEPIQVFNEGNMMRDFTYIDDIVECIARVIQKPPEIDIPGKIYNIGNNAPVKLLEFIDAIENELGITAQKEFLPLQPGDVPVTYADVDDLVKHTGFKPSTPLAEGVKEFIDWYKWYYKID